jgi:UDP-N-acetylmuramoylalanine--D-glutamate ligase
MDWKKGPDCIKGKKIGILGLGVSGKVALEFCLQYGADVTVVNQGAPSTWNITVKGQYKSFSQKDPRASECLGEQDLVLLSPGIPRNIKVLEQAFAKKVPVWNEIELASRFCKIPIIAITGTNGKTTTVSFLAHALEASGKKYFLGGNIGTPFLEWAKTCEEVDYIILELSSFQCESLDKFHPQVAAILNLGFNHGERYGGLHDYGEAKALIHQKQTGGDLLLLGEIGDLNQFPWHPGVELINLPEVGLVEELRKDLNLDHFTLAGHHNKKNLWFIYQIFKKYKIPFIGLQKSLETFGGVAHRLERISNKWGLSIFNDAKSTNWQATLSALVSLREEEGPKWLIVGGQRRGQNDLPTQQEMENLKGEVDHFLLIGEAAGDLYSFLGNERASACGDLEKAMREVAHHMISGTLIFSPAFPSFDQFKNYVERGVLFKDLVSRGRAFFGH